MSRVLMTLVVLVSALASSHAAQPPAERRTIHARHGDLVLLPPDASITIGWRTEGYLKVSAHEGWKVVVIVLDQGPHPDGTADWAYRYEVDQPYPAAYLWQGPGATEEYNGVGRQTHPRSLVIDTGSIRIAFVSAGPQQPLLPGDVNATFRTSRASWRPVRGSIDEAEAEMLAGTGARAALEFSVGVGPDAGSRPGGQRNPSAPVRVGGNVPSPRRVRDAAPVLPDAARQAGVRGTVLLEVTIDADGKVAGAKVLRSIPLLDEAALDAVRQWKYEPTFLDGQAVRVVLTVPVRFQ